MITMDNFIFDGHPLLRTMIKEVMIPLSDVDKKLMFDMVEYLKNSQNPRLARRLKLREGIGLAAPQLGIDKRIFAIYATDEAGVQHQYVLANPKVVSHSEELTYLPQGEGCLSVKRNIKGIVPRYRRVRIVGYDINNELVEIRAKGFIAIVFQHEIDHLNGKMFYDYINPNNPMMPPMGSVPVD